MKTSVNVILAAVLVFSSFARGDGKPPASQPTLETRRYDIRPLLKNTRDRKTQDPYEKSGKFADDVLGAPHLAHLDVAIQITSLICNTIEPGSWKQWHSNYDRRKRAIFERKMVH